MPNGEIPEIKKQLENHEKRIEDLENLIRGRPKRAVTKRKTILDHLTHLKSEGFFDQPKMTREIIEKLASEGYHYPHESLTGPLQKAVRQGLLGRIKKNKNWAYCRR